jgi:hypothetical protein
VKRHLQGEFHDDYSLSWVAVHTPNNLYSDFVLL